MRNRDVNRFLTGVAVLGALGWATACSSDSSTEAHVHGVELIKVTPEVDTTIIGQQVQYAATATCHCGDTLPDRTVTWQSSDPAVALVYRTGLVIGAGRGTAVISATSEGVSGAASIVVLTNPGTVTIEPAVVTLDIGETAQLTAVVRDPDGNILDLPVVWGSWDPTVVAVDANGLITALNPGTVHITATSEFAVGVAVITVRLPVYSVEVDPSEATVSVGDTLRLTATPRAEWYGVPLLDRTVVWTSGDPAVATVNATGLVAAVAPGAVIITATCEGKAGSAQITVQVPVASGSGGDGH